MDHIVATGEALMPIIADTTCEHYVPGPDAPEKRTLKVGFMPLTDCASVVMAAVKGFDEKHGIKIIPTRESSWASVRDKLLSGELDAAHALYGMVYGVQLGIGGPKRDMAILMSLNQNGQGITLSRQLREAGIIDGPSLANAVARRERTYTFAQTFPTGTHAMWLYYWLASYGINPVSDVRTITVPPPKMVSRMRAGNMDGCCVGEPWNNKAIIDNVGFSATTSQEIWPDHPEKVLGTTDTWVTRYPNSARALVAALLEASRWIDASMDNKQKTAEVIAHPAYIDTDAEVIASRMQGRYQDGLGKSWDDKHRMKFFDGGAVNFPYLSDGMWFMTQHKRWGLLDEHPDYLSVASAVNRIDIYRQGAEQAGVNVPSSLMRSSRLIDGVCWDGSDPQGYADSFSVRAEKLFV